MTQAERDRLVALKKAQKKLITQKQAAEEIGITERQVRRVLRKLRRKGELTPTDIGFTEGILRDTRKKPSTRLGCLCYALLSPDFTKSGTKIRLFN